MLAGHFGVPVSLVTGDNYAIAEARALLGDVEGAAVKIGRGRYAVRCLHPSKARAAIQQGAERAVRESARYKPFTVPAPMKMELDYANSAFADAAMWIPSAAREGPRTVSFTVPDFLVGMRTFVVAATLPYSAEDPMY